MLKIGDSAHLIGRKESVKITNIIDEVAIVEYAGGIKQKVPLVNLIKEPDGVTITPRMYDNAVISLIGTMQENAFEDGKSDDADYIVRVTSIICGQLKERLFDLND